MKRGILLLVLMCGLTTLWAADVFVANQEERIIPPDSAWIQVYDSLQVNNQQWAQQEYERLSAAYVESGHYDHALFLTNEYGFWIRAKRRQAEAIALADSMVKVCEQHLPNDHVELLYAYYNQAVSYGSHPLAYPWYSKFFANCPNYLLKPQMFQARLYFGASKMWKGNYAEAWDSWDYCFGSELIAQQKVMLYSMTGIAVRATDLEVANALLEVAWRLVNDELQEDLVNRYKTIDFLTIFTFLNEDYDKALFHALEGIDFLQGDGHSLFSYMAIPSDMHCIAAEAAFYLDRFDLGDSILTAIGEQRESFKDAVLIPAKIAQYKGTMYNELGQFDKAQQSFERCIDENIKVIGDNGLDYEFCRPYADLATNYYNQDRYDEAINLYENAVKTMCPQAYTDVADSFRFVDADSIPSFYLSNVDGLLVEMMQVYRKRYEQKGNEEDLRAILKLVDYGNGLVQEWYRNVANEETLLEAVALLKANGNHALYAYSQLVENFPQYADSAFVCADLPRSFSLNNLKSLKNKRTTSTQDSLKATINSLSVALMNFKEKDSEAYLMVQLQLLRNKMTMNELSSAAEAILTPGVDVSVIKDQIANNEVILQYTLADSVVYIASCSSAGVRMYAQDFADIEIHKMALIRALKTGESNSAVQQLWYDKLIRPVASDIKGKSCLLIYPDEAFSGVPFEAFQDPSSHYLIQHYVLDYHYSAKQWMQRPREQAMSLMLVAPGFMQNNNLDLNQTISEQTLRSDSVFYRDGDRAALLPLKYSLEEVDELDQLFVNKNIAVTKYSNAEATKLNFTQNARAYSIIHVATHGISGREQECGLFFSEPAGTSLDQDAFLPAYELYKLNLNADLVVLSACKTALGDVKTGEGVMALPRGFMYAGVPNVMASLWKIHDEKTKDFMLTFYQKLLEGKSYAEALRLAKLQAIKKGCLPLDWAGFVLLCE